MAIQFLVYSNHLTSFHEVIQLPSKAYIVFLIKNSYFAFNNTHNTDVCSIYIDIAGIVVP